MSKIEANSLIKIDVLFLKKEDFFSGERWSSIRWTSNYTGYQGSASLQSTTIQGVKFLHIRFSPSNTQEAYECDAPITSTPCNYGGERYWLLCPAWGCGRRVGTLYFLNGSFACRHCHNLTYSTQNQSKRYNGFISMPMLEAMANRVKRTHYRDKPTKKYTRYMRMHARFFRDVSRTVATLRD